METRSAIARANIKRGYKLRVVKKAKPKSFVHCTMYGFVYDERKIKKEWLK